MSEIREISQISFVVIAAGKLSSMRIARVSVGPLPHHTQTVICLKQKEYRQLSVPLKLWPDKHYIRSLFGSAVITHHLKIIDGAVTALQFWRF